MCEVFLCITEGKEITETQGIKRVKTNNKFRQQHLSILITFAY